MSPTENDRVSGPVPWTADATTATDCTLHQLAPYIGRVKTSIARYLIEHYTRPGETIVDPFAGCGVIPLEAAILGRNILAGDINPYGVTLIRAKLSAPKRESVATTRLQQIWSHAHEKRSMQDLRHVPPWVRAFFHPETLRDALALRDELVAHKEWFLLGCLLGILHHQRPGFLSYPSSHLVPYLRTKLFPRATYPELYRRRDVFSRMESKVHRAYRRHQSATASWRIFHADSRRIPLPNRIDAVITSPPYMNELDYVRDNRLRLWLLERSLPTHKDIPRRERERNFRTLMTETLTRLASKMSNKARFILIVGEASRGTSIADSAAIISDVFQNNPRLSTFRLQRKIVDYIPDIRRSRRALSGTKRETVLIFSRTN